MIPEVAEIWNYGRASREQFPQALEMIPEELFDRRPAPGAPSALEIAWHVCAANRLYCRMIREGNLEWEAVTREQCPDKAAALRLIEETQAECARTVASIEPDQLNLVRAPHWGSDPYGPLTVKWFVRQITRHTYYHTAQVNYLHFLLGLDEARPVKVK